jgi:hypothetical protein
MNNSLMNGDTLRGGGASPISIAAAGIVKAVATVTRRPRRGVLAGRSEGRLMQPQDGSLEQRMKVATIKPRNLTSMPQEPEDASLTGGTRSLTRRLLGLNFGKKVSAKPSTLVAGSITRPRVA